MTGTLYLNGAWVNGDGRSFDSTSPANGKVLWTGNEASPDQVAIAVSAAKSAFLHWRKLPIEERLSHIQKFIGLLTERKEHLALCIARETGKPLWDARTEAGAMIGKADISLKAYHERTGTKEAEAAGALMRVTHRPHGVMAVIGPFNFPGHLPNGHIIPALIAGNTIVFKPSELTPMVAEETVKIWDEAGLPQGVINLVQGGRQIAEALIADDHCAGVLFTGGINAGLAIHQALAGKPEKILALELGGNNPLIVWDAEDYDAAAKIILKSVYISSGQRCTCAKRLIVPEGNSGTACINSLNALLDKVRVDDPEMDPQPFIGPLISPGAADAVLGAQEQLIANGGIPIRKSERLAQGDAFISPGIIDVTALSERADAEIFGPLLQVIRTPTFDDAITEANDTRFGLAAGLISDSEELFQKFVTEINAGIVNWNRQTTGASSAAPFGGIGLSGNHQPAGYYSADYTAWPMASLISAGKVVDDDPIPGVDS